MKKNSWTLQCPRMWRRARLMCVECASRHTNDVCTGSTSQHMRPLLRCVTCPTDCTDTTGDLLLRHRRRCQKASKPLTRRKACDVCVQAKAKCCYSQPTCSRCAKRGLLCQYISSVDSTASNENNVEDASRRASLDNHRGQAADAAYLSVSGTSPAGNLAEAFEVPSSWSSQLSPWSLDALEIPLQGLTPPAGSGFVAVDENLGDANPDTSTPPSTFQQLTSRHVYSSLPGNDSLISHSSMMSGLSSHTSVGSLAGLDANSAPLNASNISPYHPNTFVRLLGQYPTLLLTDNFCSPIIHHVMYNEHVPDMTTLPRTSMAICCGSAIHNSDGTRYIRRAMEAERQSLIEAFVSPSQSLCVADIPRDPLG